MTIRHLKVFIQVCECDYSISRASEILCVAQPSVSQTIKELENYYGVILFNRINRKLDLTNEGKILLRKAKEIVQSFDEFEVLASNKDLDPVVKIGATTTFGAFIIPRFKKLLNDTYPNIEPRFIVVEPEGIEKKILLNEIDFGFVEGAIEDPMIESFLLGEDEIVAVSSPEYKIESPIKLKDLVKHPLLVREKRNASRTLFESQLEINGLKMGAPLLESVSNYCIFSMMLLSQGIGIVPRAIARQWSKNNNIKIIELDIPITRELNIVHHKNKIMNTNVERAFNLSKKILEIARKERDLKENPI